MNDQKLVDRRESLVSRIDSQMGKLIEITDLLEKDIIVIEQKLLSSTPLISEFKEIPEKKGEGWLEKLIQRLDLIANKLYRLRDTRVSRLMEEIEVERD